MISSFGDSIYTRKANIVEGEKDQSNLLNNIIEFNNNSRPRSKEGKDKKRDIYKRAYALYEDRELTLNVFKSGTFPIKATQGKGLKLVTPKQLLHKVKAGSPSENLLKKYITIS